MSTPIVEINSQNVLLNTAVAAADLFTASDSDDAIVSYFFQDFGLSPSSGYFAFDGVAIAHGTFYEVSAADLSRLTYVAGSNPLAENIRIMAKDAAGFVSSPDTIGPVYNVRANTTAPFARAISFDVLGNETYAGSDIVWGFDPDGYPIQSYTLRDRSVDGGYFEVDGVARTQGEFFTIAASDLAKLRYVATGPSSSELFDVTAFDGAQSSINHVGTANRAANASPPVVQYAEVTIPGDELFSLADSNPVVDADGNTIKTYFFFNTSENPDDGELVFMGEVQPRLTYVEVGADEMDMIFFDAKNQSMTQRIEVMVSDGLYNSEVNSLDITSEFVPPPPPIIKPVYKANRLSEVVEQRVAVSVSDLFDKLDGGMDYVRYQVFDPNGDFARGYFANQGIPLAAGVVQELTSAEFENQLTFVSGAFENRSLDTIYVRADNSQKWGAWEQLDIRTEPEFEDVLIGGNNWTDFLPTNALGQTVVTYSFMQEFPLYGGAEIGDEEDMEQFETFDDTQRANARMAFRHLETFANVQMLEVSDTSTNALGGQGGIIRMGEMGDADATFAAFAYLPSTNPLGGDMWFNRLTMGDGISFDPDSDVVPPEDNEGVESNGGGYTTFLHELGHAMGLRHPFSNDPDNPITPVLPVSTDSDEFSVMSYTGSPNDNGQPTTYQLYDINTFQDLYGANMSYNTGDDIYSIGRTWNGSQEFFETIWDAAGRDTLSAWGSEASAVVDLRSGQASTIGTLNENLKIAFGATIEDGVGSNFGDELYGNAVNNYLDGRAGDDFLKGGAGIDRIFSGAGSDTIEFGVADGIDILDERSEGGLDTLKITPFAGLDKLEEDFRFFMAANGTDLVVNLTLDNGESQGLVIIKNQQLARNQIETLDLNGVRIDLVNLTSQVRPDTQRFQVLETSSSQGFFVAPA